MAMAWIGHIRGGLGYVAVAAAVIMASLSGSAVADTAALASVLIPLMRNAGYDINRSCGLIACGGIIAPVIPPSIGMILFGVAGGVSITKLFIAGIVPGILMGVSIMLAWRWSIKRDNPRSSAKRTLPERLQETRKALWALALPVVIIGGLKFGAFTPDRGGGDRRRLFPVRRAVRLPRDQVRAICSALIYRARRPRRSSCSWSPRPASRPG